MGKLIALNRFPNFFLDCGADESLEVDASSTIFLLDSLLHVMDNSLPIKDSLSATIAFSQSYDCPTCYKHQNLIILHTSPSRWAQVAYQLAHELCHLAIKHDVAPNLHWLEESICELASYYFLPRLSKHWRRAKVKYKIAKTQKPYYPEFEKYVDNDKKKATQFDISNLASTTPSSELQILIDNHLLRDKNAYIAANLLPIFTRYPNTWHAIPFLSRITPNQTLQDSLKEWIEISPPEARPGLVLVAKQFGASLPVS